MSEPAASAHRAHPRPRDVPGFAQAVSAGQVPVVPHSPPGLLPGPSADRAFKVFLIRLVGAVLVVIVAMGVAKSFHSTWASLLPIGLSWVVFCLMLYWLAGVGRRNFEEFRHGYTTLVLKFGMFSSIRDLRWWITNWRVPWDYSGLWVLRGDGNVISAPAADRESPGFYPSPNRPGRYELWTGCAWAGQYRR
jgi:hypothetical protein